MSYKMKQAPDLGIEDVEADIEAEEYQKYCDSGSEYSYELWKYDKDLKLQIYGALIGITISSLIIAYFL